jgi:hypothetical protein
MEISRGARSEADTNGRRVLRGQGSDPGMGPKRGQNGGGSLLRTGKVYNPIVSGLSREVKEKRNDRRGFP